MKAALTAVSAALLTFSSGYAIAHPGHGTTGHASSALHYLVDHPVLVSTLLVGAGMAALAIGRRVFRRD